MRNVEAAKKYMKEVLGAQSFEVIETRSDPKVSGSELVRFKVNDRRWAKTPESFFLLIQDGQVLDECFLEKGQNTLKDIPTGPLKFY